MACWRFWRGLALLLWAGWASPGIAATVPDADWPFVSQAWRIEAARPGMSLSAALIRKREPLVLWPDSDVVPASAVHFLSGAPFERVLPVVQRTLRKWSVSDQFPKSTRALAYFPDDWITVLLSRRPDLREALARFDNDHDLDLAEQLGALTAKETLQRKAEARQGLAWSPQSRIEIGDFQKDYGAWFGSSGGTRDPYPLAVIASVLDVSAAFGRPATAVSLMRVSSYHNPNYRPFRDFLKFDLFASSASRTLHEITVPGEVFEAVRGALQFDSGTSLSVADSPLRWLSPVAPVERGSAKPRFVDAASSGPVLMAEPIVWSASTEIIDERFEPMGLVTLPDGSLLISSEYYDGEGNAVGVWRMREVKDHWVAERIWKGANGARRLVSSADGQQVWFSDENNDMPRWNVYDVTRGVMSTYAIASSKEEGPLLRGNAWFLDSEKRPLATHTRYDVESEIGSSLLEFLTFEPKAGRNSMLSPRTEFSTLRQSIMPSLIRMTGLNGQQGVWVEDDDGLAWLNRRTGRVERALALPQRGMSSARGFAPWAPAAFGSDKAQWMAVGFVLPRPEADTRCDERYVGMHVVDLPQERLRFSALLGCSSTLQAAARSANGRYLALGSNAPEPDANAPFALWDARTGEVPLRLLTIRSREVRGMAFSWNGADLWALTSGVLLRWRLPVRLRDAAVEGDRESFPEQSFY